MFREMSDDNDLFRSELEAAWKITGDDDDLVSKADLEDYFKTRLKMDFAEVRANLRRMNIKYIRDKRLPGRQERGAVCGLKEWTEEMIKEEDEKDEKDTEHVRAKEEQKEAERMDALTMFGRR